MAPSESAVYWPVSKIRARIAREFPQFRHSKVRVINRGHSLVVELDWDYIFKFVWHPKSNLKKEVETLRLIGGKTGIKAPDPIFIGKGYKFFGCPKIMGVKPDAGQVRKWSAQKRLQLAVELAWLCGEVQRAIPSGDRYKTLGAKLKPMSREEIDSLAESFRSLFSGSKPLVKASVRVFNAYKKRQTDLAGGKVNYIGFDLQFDNLLLDTEGGLAGVVDFGYLTWTDAPGLFGLLFKDDPELARMAIKGFERIAGERIPIEQAKAQGLFSVFSYLVELSTNRWDMAKRRKEWLKIARRYC